MKPLTNLLVKPSGADCNLDCSYCFYLEKENLYSHSSQLRMSHEILEEMIIQFCQQCSNGATIGWQGGEPTLMGIDFFNKALELQNRFRGNKTINNTFQTNGILINQDWIRLFLKGNFLVGLSIDGPAEIHDYYRVNKSGANSHKKVEECASSLLQAGVQVNALTCVTDQSAKEAKKTYQYLKSLGFSHLQFIPVVEKSGDQLAPWSVRPHDYGEFLIEIFELWIKDFVNGVPSVSVRYFEDLFHLYLGFAAPDCVLSQECGSYLVVEHNGDVYSCDFFVEKEWLLGNINEDKLFALLNDTTQTNFGQLKRVAHPDCQTCQWYDKCYGGCPKDRKNNVDKRLSYFCESYKIFLSFADSKMKELAIQWRQTYQPDENSFK